MKNKYYRLFRMNKITYVLTPSRLGQEPANFMGTGMALAGIIKSNNLQEFIDKQPELTEKHMAMNETCQTVFYQQEYRRKQRQSLTSKSLYHE